MAYTAPSIAASGITFLQLQAAGVSGHLERLIAAQPSTTNPDSAPTAAATVAESGSGGTLPTATYYVVVTEVNGIGETTSGGFVSAGQAITLGQDLVVTFAALKTGNTARNTYVGTSGTGPFTLAATGTTASTVTISAPLPANSYADQPPLTNSTGLSATKLSLIRSCKNGNMQNLYRFHRNLISMFSSGEPIDFAGLMTKFHDVSVAYAMLATMAAEQGVLLDANAGTLGVVATGIGGIRPHRTWP